jgi:large subunit ribosomal protein L10
MTRVEKGEQIAELKEKFSNSSFFYLTDSSTLSVEKINKLRGMLYEKNIEMRVVKNTLAQKALEAVDVDKGYAPLFEALKGPTAILFTETANAPAKVITAFRKGGDRPILKGAYIDSSIYLGDDQLAALAALKSKEELVGEIISLLQSPAKNVISALKSGGSTISGLLKTLEERGE